MAHIDSIFFHRVGHADMTMTVHTKLKPAGEAQVKVDLPPDFKDCILKMAQNAADLHEQQMRAQILADNAAPEQPGTINTGEENG